jgi:biopolymer transport protein ExbB
MITGRHPYEDFVHRVQKPARYLGGEFGARTKDWSAVDARVCLAFPDVYDIGMSHLGFKILYKILNDEPRTLAERAYALRRAAVMPADLVDAVVSGKSLVGGRHTVLARIVEFAEQHRHDEGAVKAFARLELNRMERGIPYLDVIYAAAPLIGLTGTVTGLLQVFSQISPDTGLPDPVAFTKGVALALSATVIGLTIAIPSLVGSGYLQRKIENYAAQLDVLLERILQRARPQ